jgi:hypothetical protein
MINPVKTNRSNFNNDTNKMSKEFNAIDELDNAIEKGELELQKAMSLLRLEIDVDKAFEAVLDCMDEIEKIASSIEDESVSFLATEKIVLYSKHFDEIIKQVPSKYQN